MPIRMSGIVSGLDTESLVSALVSSYNLEKDNLVKAQTKLSWKEDKWKAMNKSIYSFYSGTLSKAQYSKTYNLKSAAISNSSYATVSASTTAVTGTQSLEVNKLASTGYLTGAKISGTDSTTPLSGDSKLSTIAGLSGLTTGTLKVTVDGKTTSIAVTPDMTVNQFVSKMKESGLNASFDTTNQRFFVSAPTSGASHDFTMTADDQGGLTALQNLGLYTSNATDTAEYQKWAAYASDSTALASAIDAEYQKEKLSYTTAATQYADQYNTAKSTRDAIASANGGYDAMQTQLSTYKSTLSSTYSKYATTTDGTTTYDTNAMKTDGVLDNYNTLQKSITNMTNLITQYDSNQSTMDHVKQYVNLNGDGTAKAATASDSDATAWNNVVTEVDSENTATKNSITTQYTNKANFAKQVMDGSVSTTASAGASRVVGSDSEIVLNGATFTNNTNSFSINGLTITALTKTNGAAVSITTNTDVDGIYKQIKSLLSSYNTLITSMDTAYNAASSKGFEPLTSAEKKAMTSDEVTSWETKIKDSLLRKDDVLGSTSSSMKTDMLSTFKINGTSYSLSTFGIATLNYFSSGDNEKGVYHIDGDSDDSSTSGNTDKLKAAIASDPDTVVSFFSQLSQTMYSDLTKRMASSSLKSAFTIYNDKELATEYSDYNTKISDKSEEISTWEDFYYSKFSRMESALASLNSQSSSLAGLLNS